MRNVWIIARREYKLLFHQPGSLCRGILFYDSPGIIFL